MLSVSVCMYVCCYHVTHVCAVGMCYTSISITELLVRPLYAIGYSDAIGYRFYFFLIPYFLHTL